MSKILENKCANGCPFGTAINIIGGKWKGIILWHLLEREVLRNSEMLRLIHPITQKMLTQQLREMEKDGLVTRTIYEQIPPKVEYRTTLQAEALRPVLALLYQWGEEYVRNKKA
ncbi:MAG: putative HTH-type transcriptional regulator YybR [Legionellaceae bacterium]